MIKCNVCYKPKVGAFFGHQWSLQEGVEPHVFCIECLTKAWAKNTEKMKSNVCLACTELLIPPEQFDAFMNVLSYGKLFTLQDYVNFVDGEDSDSEEDNRLDRILRLVEANNNVVHYLRERRAPEVRAVRQEEITWGKMSMAAVACMIATIGCFILRFIHQLSFEVEGEPNYLKIMIKNKED